MVQLLQTLGRSHLWKGLVLALVVATLGNIVIAPHKALAGGAIMIGQSIVTGGKDRVSGHSYAAFPGDPAALVDSRRFLPNPTVIRSYPGDTVRFTGVIWNVDPFPIPGYAHLAMIQKGFNEPLQLWNPIQYITRGDAHVADSDVFTFGTGVPVVPYVSNFLLRPPAVTLSTSAKPGQQYCQFVQTIPMFYLGYIPVIPYFEWKIPDLININLGVNGNNLNTSFTDGNGNPYGVETQDPNGAPGGSVVGNNGQTYGTHSTWNVSFGRMMSCAEIAYVYDLEPTITLNEAASTPTKMTVAPAVSEGDYKQLQPDAPSATDTQKTEWQISQLFVPQNQTPPTGFTQFDPANNLFSGNKVCAYFFKKYNYNCSPSKQSSGKDTVLSSGAKGDALTIKSGSQLPTDVDAPGTIPPGYKLCYVLSVNSHRPVYPEWNSEWRNSPVVCSTRSGDKSPKVQILGDDVRVGGKIATSLTPVSSLSQVFGSWGQYASFSGGAVTGFATASGLKGGKPDAITQPAYSALTFANSNGASGKFGEFSNHVNSTGAANYFLSQPSQSITSVDLSTMSGSKMPYRYDNTSNLDINGGTIPKGQTIIIVASGDVTIKSDIHYTTDPLTTLDDIPQVVIVAKNIYIDQNVTNIDAWLIADSASGTINTCAQVPNTADLTVSTCTNQLTVNGPVVTNKLFLHRTHGSEGTSAATLDEPAEIFRNRGDSYLWAWNYAKNNSNLISTKQTELPPRY